MRRVVAAAVVVVGCLVLLLAALGLLLASLFLALATLLPLWLAAFATSMTCLLSVVGLILIATRGRGSQHHLPHSQGTLASTVVRRYPLGAAGTALAAGVLVASSETTRKALITSVDSYVRAVEHSG